jgi:CBS domain-containing protein
MEQRIADVMRMGLNAPVRTLIERDDPVGSIMASPPISVMPETSVVRAEALAEQHGVHHLPVVEGSGLVGVVCTCDLWKPHAVLVAECMSHRVASILASDTLMLAIARMRRWDVGCLPVMDRRRLVGMITRGDVRRVGLPVREDEPTCSSCLGLHHVRRLAETQVAFCLDCLRAREPLEGREHYEEIGVGD